MNTDYFVHTLVDPRTNKHYFTHETAFHRIMHRLAGPIISGLVMDIRVKGVEHVPTSGAAILAVNHLTLYDVFPIQLMLPGRPVFYMAKEELFRTFFTDQLFRYLLAFPVHRGEGDVWAMDFALQVLRDEQVLVIFPEGTRSRGRGLGIGKSGAARLALQAQCPIIPVALDGTQRIFVHFPCRTHVTVNISEPIIPETGDDPALITQKMMDAIADMLPDELKGRSCRLLYKDF
jgi:1-acyl-sn-glycerol-3-phosphate acyltransferase